MTPQTLTFTQHVGEALDAAIGRLAPSSIFVLADSHTATLVVPELHSQALREATLITIEAGDAHKDLAALTHVWQALQTGGATRKSLMVNVGGGVVTDLGGLAAATFKRGINFINVPTTLLGAVDAAVGGKTGINFGGLKNEVGIVAMAAEVIVSTRFFVTLPPSELRSGFAEVLKHGLLKSGDETLRLLDYDIEAADLDTLLPLLETSVRVKQDIVLQDPLEHGLRRALNLGHTVGHAFESMALRQNAPIPHGYAVAWGLAVELVLSHMKLQFDTSLLYRVVHRVRDIYGTPRITCDDYPALLDLMRHDKKSERGEINCTLLRAPGDVVTGNAIADDEMTAALDIWRDLMGM